jgi:hypothetical protein
MRASGQMITPLAGLAYVGLCVRAALVGDAATLPVHQRVPPALHPSGGYPTREPLTSSPPLGTGKLMRLASPAATTC